jgi:hypothetical protein
MDTIYFNSDAKEMNVKMLYHVNCGHLTSKTGAIVDFTNFEASWGEKTIRHIKKIGKKWYFSRHDIREENNLGFCKFYCGGATFDSCEVEEAYKKYKKDSK